MTLSERSQDRTPITEDFSWSRHLVILSTDEAPEWAQISRVLRGLQARGVEKLREAIEDPAHSTSWERPFLGLRMDFPFEWNTEVALSSLDDRRDRQQRDLLSALQVSTAGAAVAVHKDGFLPMLSGRRS